MLGQIEFEVDGRQYKADRLNAFQQFHVNRRLAPLIVQMISALGQDGVQVSGAEVMKQVGRLGGMAEALASMKDDDLDFILDTCLSVVFYKDEGAWKRLLAQNGFAGGYGLMLEGFEWTSMLQVVWKVVEANLGNFMRALPSTLTGAGASSGTTP